MKSARTNARWRRCLGLARIFGIPFVLALAAPPARADDATVSTTNAPAPQADLQNALPADDADTEPPKRRLVSWNQYEGRWVSLRVSGMFLGDVSGYSQDSTSVNQVGALNPDVQLRSFRLSGSGQIKFEQPWTYVITGEYRGFDRGSDSSSSDTWQVTDLALTIPIPGVGRLSIGKQKEPMSLERLTGRATLEFMERPTVLDSILPSRNEGLKLSSTAFDERMTWSAGWFNTWFGGSQSSFVNSANSAAARVTWLPIADTNTATLLHVGASARYAQEQSDVLRYKGRPEDNQAPYYVDTGNFTADHETDLDLETGWQEGPVLTSAEYLADWVGSSSKGNPFFDGLYLSSGWMLTGEHRDYNRTGGFWGRISPAHPLFHGGWGALELAGRFSWTDLDNAGISGGKFARWTGALDWFATDYMRLQFNYGYGRLDRFGTQGDTQFFQARLQLEF